MTFRRLFPPALAAAGLIAIVLLAAGFGLSQSPSPARALPPAGTDNLYVTADVDIASRLGSETVHLTGTVTIERSAPAGNPQVVVIEVTSLNLTGTASNGQVVVTHSDTRPTTGEIRSLQMNAEYPASSFFDVFVSADVPGSPFSPLQTHNEQVIHLVASTNLNSWPPYGITFEMQPGAGATATPTTTPFPTPQGGGVNCSTGVKLLMDQHDPNVDPWWPAQLCIRDVSMTLSQPPTATPTVTPCVPTCTATPTPTGPLPTSTRTPRPTATSTPLPGPFFLEDTVFSVGRNGPSNLHPADLLARGGSTAPIPVSGNDNFSNPWPIGGLPFAGVQDTLTLGVESNEPLTTGHADPSCIPQAPSTMSHTAWYDLTPGVSGNVTVSTQNSNFDTVLAVYTGSSLGALTLVDCIDDYNDNLWSQIDFAGTSGTTYHIQVGGFGSHAGNLRLDVSGPAGAGVEGLHTAISCTGLGLSSTGCDNGQDGSQDDVDAVSFGDDFFAGDIPMALSVAPGSTGLASSGVAAQAACSPAEPQADIFASDRDGANALAVDGDGASNDCPTAPAVNLQERATSDNLDAFSGEPISVVDTDNDGQLDRPVFMSLSAGSPTLVTLARGPADILWTSGFSPGLFASAAQLGLQPTDDIDAMCVQHPGAGVVYNPAQDKVLFSLAPGSPTLATLGASAADVLAPGPKVAIRAYELGLKAADNLDALDCSTVAGAPAVTIPVGDIWFCNSSYGNGVECPATIHAGEKVRWEWVGDMPHSVTECGASCDNPTNSPLFDSGVLNNGASFEYTFSQPGTYYYYCEVHGPSQKGRIIVQPAGNATPTPTPPARVYGDANKDGLINAVDAALILQYSAGLISSINQNADANNDGTVNPIDATLVLQYSAGLITHLP